MKKLEKLSSKAILFYKNYAFPINAFLIWRIIILFFQLFIQPNLGPNTRSETLYDRLYLSWNTYWDAGHYITIADKGYTYPLQNFFPLWSVIIRAVTLITQSSHLASYLTTIIFGLITSILLYIIGKTFLTDLQTRTALILFLSYPGAMFLHAGYTETPFLMLSLLSFLCIERKQYFLAAFIGGWTSATRLVGIIMPAIFFVLRIPLIKKFILMATSGLGLVFYCTYLFLSTGDALYFKEAQKHWCELNDNCTLTFPITTLYNEYQLLPNFEDITQNGIGYDTLNWIFSVLFLIIPLFTIKKIPLHYTLYALLIVAFPLSTGSTTSMMRYVVIAFPAFYSLAIIIKNKYLRAIIILIFAILQLQAIKDFTNFDWVALIDSLQA